MSETLELVIGADFFSDVQSHALTGFTNGVTMEELGFQQSLDGEEVINLVAQDTTQPDVAAHLIEITRYILQCRYQLNPAERYQVWLKAKTDTEGTARRALVTSLNWGGRAAIYDDVFRKNKLLNNLQLVLVRRPWEAPTAVEKTFTGLDSLDSSFPVMTIGDEVMATGSTELEYSGTLDHYPVVPGTILADGIAGGQPWQVHDDGEGTLHHDFGRVVSGTINYDTGAWTLFFQMSPSGSLLADYSYGGTNALTVIGELDARLGYLYFAPGAGSGAITELWWGFRSERNGDLDAFVNEWLLVLGNMESADCSTHYDTNYEAYLEPGGHNCILCTFGTTAALVNRVSLTPYQVRPSGYNDLRGTYRVLLSGYVGSSTVARVRIGTGFGTTFNYQPLVEITKTGPYLVDLGVITLPCGGSVGGLLGAMRNSKLMLQAERSSGSGSLHLSRLILIPIDEGGGHLFGGGGYVNIGLCDALGRVSGFTYDSGNYINGILDTSGVNPNECILPAGLCSIVVAAQRATVSNWEDTVNVVIEYFPRYRIMSA